ncbi:Os03g0604401 [Oryza sativa Japonica Group]|nr:Os03g0604401 [Oryza sativa Japonica Group]
MAMPPEVCTRFHLISLSEGFDLSSLFEHDPAVSPGRATARAGSTRFATREAASGVVTQLEALATGGATPTRVARSGARGVRLAMAADRRLQRGTVVARGGPGGRQEGWR